MSVKGRAGSARRESLEALDDLEPAALFRLILTFGSESLFSSACLTVRVSLSSCAGSEVVLVEEAWDVRDCQLRGRAASAGASSASIDGTGEGRASVGAAFDCWSGVAPEEACRAALVDAGEGAAGCRTPVASEGRGSVVGEGAALETSRRGLGLFFGCRRACAGVFLPAWLGFLEEESDEMANVREVREV